MALLQQSMRQVQRSPAKPGVVEKWQNKEIRVHLDTTLCTPAPDNVPSSRVGVADLTDVVVLVCASTTWAMLALAWSPARAASMLFLPNRHRHERGQGCATCLTRGTRMCGQHCLQEGTEFLVFSKVCAASMGVLWAWTSQGQAAQAAGVTWQTGGPAPTSLSVQPPHRACTNKGY